METSAHNRSALPLAYGGTLLFSALLLFSIQPLAGKLLLPLLGGAPAVWNTVMVFFQAMLLLGYAYAHWSVRFLGIRRQLWAHLGVLGLAAVTLPFSIAANTSTVGQPALWVLITLAKEIGLPVFALAATAPLLQRWFACTDDPAADDPYFLYAASNAGSFAALFAYPLMIEPVLGLPTQVGFWSAGFWLLAAMIGLCAWLLRSSARPAETTGQGEGSVPKATAWKWIGLAFVPSSLMLGVTNYITTDVASVPLLWVLPLALYLLTFVIAFSERGQALAESSSRAVPILALAVVFPMLVQATEPVLVLVALHLFFFFFAALQCHLKLARGRPPAGQLTQFYLYMSVGGVLGGIFNALLAPILFNSIVEYPLVILAATIIGYPERATRKPKFRIPPVYGGAIIILAMTAGAALVAMAAQRSVGAGNVLAGLLLLGSFLLIQTPIRYTLAIATLLVCTAFFRNAQTRLLDRDRNFFGVLRVTDEGPVRKLFHGTTIHGVQFTAPERACEPLSYYHRQGPVTEVMRLFEAGRLKPKVGLVGLGAGAMISYSQPGQHWTLYEIDPAVVRIAQDTNNFTYLSRCARAPYEVELGDARLKLQNAADGSFGVLFIDAFSSDVIPMHLLTVEAVKLYRQKLASNGIIAFHLSSRHFELEPLVANVGDQLGLFCFSSTRGELTPQAIAEGGLESTWVILVNGFHIARIVEFATWQRVEPDPSGPVWTDDFSSLLGVLRLH